MTNLSSLSRARVACAASAFCGILVLVFGIVDGLEPVATLGGAATLFCGAAAFVILGRTAMSLRQSAQVCHAASLGDFEARIVGIRERGDLGEMMWAINGLVDRTDAYVRETVASMGYVSRGRYFRSIIETGMVGSFLGGARTINAATRSIAERVADFKGVTQRFESIVQGVVEGVVSAATELDATAASMDTTARGAQGRVTAVATASKAASASMQTVTGASEQLTASIAEIGGQATRSSDISGGAVDDMGQVRQRMSELREGCERIGQVVQMITEIASQTNLLALNATIEAARAGQAGKGFAVVAQEVKQLANEAARATETIDTQVASIREATRTACEGFDRVGDTIQDLHQAAAAIAAAVEQQSAATKAIVGSVVHATAGTQDVTGNIARVSEAACETGHAAEEVLNAAGQLSGEAERLRTEVADFLEEVHRVV